jgi:hypothetical protein
MSNQQLSQIILFAIVVLIVVAAILILNDQGVFD